MYKFFVKKGAFFSFVDKNGHAKQWISSLCEHFILLAPLRFPSAYYTKITVAAFLPWRGSF